MTAADLPAADAALRAAVPGPARPRRRRDPVPRRAGRRGRRRDPRRRRGGRPPRPDRVRGAAGGLHDRRGPRPGRPARPGSVAPARATRSRGTNVLREHRYGWGDVDAASAADVVVEGTYTFPMVTQFAIEPHAFMAAPDGDGIAIWSSIQHPNWLQRVIAGAARPAARQGPRLRARSRAAAFGGKQHAKYEPLVAFMALRAGRPVRLVLTLEETFQAVRRGASEIRVRSGFRPDGSARVPRHRGELPHRRVRRHRRPDGRQGQLHARTGRTACPPSGSSPGASCRTPSPSTAFRGFGNPQQIWAVESNMNEAARVLGIDPLELRLRNLARPGDAVHPRRHAGRRRLARRRVERAAELIGWGTPAAARARPRHRRRAQVRPDDRSLLLDRPAARRRQRRSSTPGTSDMGQGARTIFAQIAAEELGAPLDWVTVVMGDTAIVPYDQQTSASRSSVLMGNADPARLPRHPGEAPGDGGAARVGRRGARSSSTAARSGSASGSCRSATSSSAGWAGSAARSSASARCARRPSRTIRSAARPRSSSSTAPPSRSRSTARPATSRSPAT